METMSLKPNSPLLFDEEGHRKPAYLSVLLALKEAGSFTKDPRR
jgi:hypothetical protein